jgi:hypothetical protein
MYGQQNDKYTEMHGQQNDKYTEMYGQQNDKYTEVYGQQNVKKKTYSLISYSGSQNPFNYRHVLVWLTVDRSLLLIFMFFCVLQLFNS